ncbi:MAG: hypothetical protein GC190_03080 [Alphaproteobacteria bacterium]|nr:hypothetical protein [Alphaproteobacteria bacterium]
MSKHAIAPLVCAAILCLGAEAMAADPAPKTTPAAPASGQVSFCGPVEPVEACLVVHNEMAGSIGDYEISGAWPQPRPDDLMSGHGTLDGAATCGDHRVTRLKDVVWKKVDVCALGGN